MVGTPPQIASPRSDASIAGFAHHTMLHLAAVQPQSQAKASAQPKLKPAQSEPDEASV